MAIRYGGDQLSPAANSLGMGDLLGGAQQDESEEIKRRRELLEQFRQSGLGLGNFRLGDMSGGGIAGPSSRGLSARRALGG
jgi:hypothetical protein